MYGLIALLGSVQFKHQISQWAHLRGRISISEHQISIFAYIIRGKYFIKYTVFFFESPTTKISHYYMLF